MSQSLVKTVAALLLLLFAATALAGCSSETVDDNPKATAGGILGATGGGLLAYAAGGGPAGIIAGVIIGGLLGGAIGNRLDQKDKELAMKNAQLAFESNKSGQSSTWHNPDSGASGSLTPTRTFQKADGQYCREYQQEIVVGGKTEQAHGTACRQEDGSWQIQS